MGAELLLLLLATGVAPTTVDVTAVGTTRTGTVQNAERDRFRMVVPDKGTVLIVVEPIHGPPPLVRLLRVAKGKEHPVRRAVQGKLWARLAAGTELLLEIKSPYRDASSTYHLAVAFDVDRPRALREQPRPLRPRDIVRVKTSNAAELDGVRVGGLSAVYSVNGADVLVTIPAFAQHGPIELRFESAPPQRVDVVLIGTEPPNAGRAGCAHVPGCLALTISPSIGSRWLEAIARLLDADISKHDVASGSVELELRLPSAESYALEQLRRMPGVMNAQRVERGLQARDGAHVVDTP